MALHNARYFASRCHGLDRCLMSDDVWAVLPTGSAPVADDVWSVFSTLQF